MQRIVDGFEPTSVVQPPSRRLRVLPAAFALSAALVVVAVCSSKMMHGKPQREPLLPVLLTGVSAAAEAA